MEQDAQSSAALGWPKLKYAQIERERRWLCNEVPQELVVGSKALSDIYFSETQLRLRVVRDLATNAFQFKLTRKADISPNSRIITTIYLSESELDLFARLPGKRLEKVRHSLRLSDGNIASVDVFSGSLDGLRLIEMEFESEAGMTSYQPPKFAGAEVTADLRYNGGNLATQGMPPHSL